MNSAAAEALDSNGNFPLLKHCKTKNILKSRNKLPKRRTKVLVAALVGHEPHTFVLIFKTPRAEEVDPYVNYFRLKVNEAAENEIRNRGYTLVQTRSLNARNNTAMRTA